MEIAIKEMDDIQERELVTYPDWFNLIIPLLQEQVDKCHKMYSIRFPDEYAREFPGRVAARDKSATGGSLWPGTSDT